MRLALDNSPSVCSSFGYTPVCVKVALKSSSEASTLLCASSRLAANTACSRPRAKLTRSYTYELFSAVAAGGVDPVKRLVSRRLLTLAGSIT